MDRRFFSVILVDSNPYPVAIATPPFFLSFSFFYCAACLYKLKRGGGLEPNTMTAKKRGPLPNFPIALCTSKSTYLTAIFSSLFPSGHTQPCWSSDSAVSQPIVSLQMKLILFLTFILFLYFSPISSFFLASFSIFFYCRPLLYSLHLLGFFLLFLFSDLSIFQPTILLLLHLSILLLYLSPSRLFFLLSFSTFVPFLPPFLYHSLPL